MAVKSNKRGEVMIVECWDLFLSLIWFIQAVGLVGAAICCFLIWREERKGRQEITLLSDELRQVLRNKGEFSDECDG